MGLSKADAIIVDNVGAEKVEAIGERHRATLRHKILVGNIDKNLENKGWISLQTLIEQNGHEELDDILDTPSDQTLQIYFTSGTTGAPKMCAHTHGSYGYCHWVILWLKSRNLTKHVHSAGLIS